MTHAISTFLLILFASSG